MSFMPLSKYVTHDKSKMISFVTTWANSALKRSVQLQMGKYSILPGCCSLLQITVDEEMAGLYIVIEISVT